MQVTVKATDEFRSFQDGRSYQRWVGHSSAGVAVSLWVDSAQLDDESKRATFEMEIALGVVVREKERAAAARSKVQPLGRKRKP